MTSCGLLSKTAAVDPEVHQPREAQAHTKVLSCAGWHGDREAGVSPEGRPYETPCSVSPQAIIYLLTCAPTIMGCPRAMKARSSRQRSRCWWFQLLPSISRMVRAIDGASNYLLCLSPSFPSTPPLLYLLTLRLTGDLDPFQTSSLWQHAQVMRLHQKKPKKTNKTSGK